MTVSLPPVAPVAAPLPPTPPSPVVFPLGWLLEHAAPPIQYRATVEVARLTGEGPGRLASVPYGYPPAIELAISQRADGSWGPSMLAAGTGRGIEGVGTVNAVRRLLEYGWDHESPPMLRARRLLFRLLAEDDDPAYLFDFADAGDDPDLIRRGRGILREAAAAALAQAGYEGDPRLRGAARRIMDRMNRFLRSPIAMKPWVRVGNRQVLSADAAPPSIYSLSMLAHMPLFRAEYHDVMARLYQYILQPMPRQESMQLCGSHIVPQPHLVLGDMLPHRNAVDGDVPFALFWLEMMARLGYLRKNEGWTKLFDRFLDDRGRDGVWHPHNKGTATPASSNPYVWPFYPLDRQREGEDNRWTDVTFRLGLIARLAGRPIEIV